MWAPRRLQQNPQNYGPIKNLGLFVSEFHFLLVACCYQEGSMPKKCWNEARKKPRVKGDDKVKITLDRSLHIRT
jgi:hypothetical protein